MIRSTLLRDSGRAYGVESCFSLRLFILKRLCMGEIGVGNVMLLFTDTLFMTPL